MKATAGSNLPIRVENAAILVPEPEQALGVTLATLVSSLVEDLIIQLQKMPLL
jgi:hypothetical protein